jgi:hypothetical protein
VRALVGLGTFDLSLLLLLPPDADRSDFSDPVSHRSSFLPSSCETVPTRDGSRVVREGA